MGDRLENVEEQVNARLDAKAMLVAVAIDALTIHVLQHKVWLSGGGDACIDEMSDMWMGEFREKIAFTPKTLFAGASDQGDAQELDRRASFEASIAPLGQPHAAHPALTDW